jgi:predicted nucleic acid-binding protein
MSSAIEGVLDTNVFLHAHAHDSAAQECQDFLAALEDGRVRAHLEPIVLHELTYVLPRFLKSMTRQQVAQYLLVVLTWDGVQGEKDLMASAVQRWRDTPGLSFVDAYLAALAIQRGCAVYTKNVRDLRGQGVEVPDTLPAGC